VTENGNVSGNAVIRACRTVFKIGPLFADSPLYAENLFRSQLSPVPEGESVYIDIPETNPYALALVKKYGMEIVFETARMYKGQCPDLPMDRIYGVTSFELG
jgi:hypothetical protein